MVTEQPKKDRWAGQNILLERHEAKYIIPRSIVPAIREFIRPFCVPDPHTRGTPPEYVLTTLQLDSPSLSLHHAKEWDALARFKLRVRTYGTDGKSPVFLEVKRKIKGVIVKSRASVPAEKWCEDLVMNPLAMLHFRSSKEEHGYLEFCRLTREIGARPVILIRYTREAYMGINDHYARVSMDRNLLYQPTTEWTGWGAGRRWHPMDSPTAQNKLFDFSGLVLELKMLSDAPQWMIDMTREFDLVRVGNCKYSTAVWLESIFRGVPHAPLFAGDLLRF